MFRTDQIIQPISLPHTCQSGQTQQTAVYTLIELCKLLSPHSTIVFSKDFLQMSPKFVFTSNVVFCQIVKTSRPNWAHLLINSLITEVDFGIDPMLQ